MSTLTHGADMGMWGMMRRACVFALACVRVRLLCRWRLSLCNFPADANMPWKGFPVSHPLSLAPPQRTAIPSVMGGDPSGLSTLLYNNDFGCGYAACDGGFLSYAGAWA